MAEPEAGPQETLAEHGLEDESAGKPRRLAVSV